MNFLKLIRSILLVLFIFVFGCKNENSTIISDSNSRSEIPFAIVIHGGAGTIKKSNMTPDQEIAYRNKLQEALDVGYKILKNGGSSLDAVQKTINIMEDSPLFNAGKGAVFNNQEKNEMDASIMDGRTLNTGAVVGVKHIKNPINAARIVMDSSRHVMLSEKGAEDFARSHNVQLVDDDYFFTEKRFKQLQRAKKKDKISLDHTWMNNKELIDDHKYGTVGAVALDIDGNISAATSTGGLTNKKYGRVGDSPIIGAGTYANNRTCGVSSTGTGEFFIRTVAAHEVSSLLQYKGLNLKSALDNVVEQIDELGGDGGIISLDKNGNVA